MNSASKANSNLYHHIVTTMRPVGPRESRLNDFTKIKRKLKRTAIGINLKNGNEKLAPFWLYACIDLLPAKMRHGERSRILGRIRAYNALIACTGFTA
jgi:hypothetical protein